MGPERRRDMGSRKMAFLFQIEFCFCIEEGSCDGLFCVSVCVALDAIHFPHC